MCFRQIISIKLGWKYLFSLNDDDYLCNNGREYTANSVESLSQKAYFTQKFYKEEILFEKELGSPLYFSEIPKSL